MRRLAALAIFLFLVLPSPSPAQPIPATGTVEVFFSPDPGGTQAAIIRELNHAQTEILIQAYSFTSRPISKAIIEAKKRGVQIRAILDKSNVTDRYSAATFLTHAGVPVLIDSAPPLAHSKTIIIDRKTLITGSYNFTKQAEKNSENCLIFKGNQALINRYIQNVKLRESQSERF